MPPSETPWPAGLWPPLRTASSVPVCAGEPDDVGDVVRVGGAGDDGRPAVDAGHEDGARLVVAGVLRRDGGALDGGEREHASRVTARTRASLTVSHRFAGGYPYRRALLVPEPLRRR